MIWVLLWLLVGVLWGSSYFHSLHLEVSIEGHDIGYDLHGFSWSWLSSWMFGSLTLDLRLVGDCDN